MASSLGDNFNLLSPQQVLSPSLSLSNFNERFWIRILILIRWLSQQELVKVLLDNGQEHLFRDWPAPGVDDNHKKAFFDQVLFYSFAQFKYIDPFLPSLYS